jgi:hypothetical protein
MEMLMNRRKDAGGSAPLVCDNDNKSTFPEALSQKGAMALAKKLQTYWHDQGYPAARFWVEPIGERFDKVGTYELYRVVCNLLNGLPPKYRDDP